MAVDNKYERCEPESHDRCQGALKGIGGQCHFKAVKDTKYCPMHTGFSTVTSKIEEEQKSNYRFAKYQARVERFANNPQVKSLREEVGVTRMLLEEIVNSCNDEADLIIKSGKISEMVMKIEKLVVSCHKLEVQSGLLLDKVAITNFANTLVVIINDHVKDSNIVSVIADKILNSITQLQADTSPVTVG